MLMRNRLTELFHTPLTGVRKHLLVSHATVRGTHLGRWICCSYAELMTTLTAVRELTRAYPQLFVWMNEVGWAEYSTDRWAPPWE